MCLTNSHNISDNLLMLNWYTIKVSELLVTLSKVHFSEQWTLTFSLTMKIRKLLPSCGHMAILQLDRLTGMWFWPDTTGKKHIFTCTSQLLEFGLLCLTCLLLLLEKLELQGWGINVIKGIQSKYTLNLQYIFRPRTAMFYQAKINYPHTIKNMEVELQDAGVAFKGSRSRLAGEEWGGADAAESICPQTDCPQWNLI